MPARVPSHRSEVSNRFVRLAEPGAHDQRLTMENIMLLASVFRAISLQMCRFPRTPVSDVAFGRGVQRPNTVPRWKPVRGAASEPHYTDAHAGSIPDGSVESPVR